MIWVFFFPFIKAVAKFMGRVRGDRVKFDPNRIVMSGGATGANETIMFCLADPGDAFLVPTPYYPAYILFFCVIDLIFIFVYKHAIENNNTKIPPNFTRIFSIYPTCTFTRKSTMTRIPIVKVIFVSSNMREGERIFFNQSVGVCKILTNPGPELEDTKPPVAPRVVLLAIGFQWSTMIILEFHNNGLSQS